MCIRYVELEPFIYENFTYEIDFTYENFIYERFEFHITISQMEFHM